MIVVASFPDIAPATAGAATGTPPGNQPVPFRDRVVVGQMRYAGGDRMREFLSVADHSRRVKIFVLPFSPVALNEEPIAEEASLIPVGRAVGAGRGLVGNQRRRGPARDSRANYTRAVAQAWPGTRGVEFAPDSPLEGTGFELLVRGRGEAGCGASCYGSCRK